MKPRTSIPVLLSFLLTPVLSSREPMKFACQDPTILDDDAGYLELLPAAEFRKAAMKYPPRKASSP